MMMSDWLEAALSLRVVWSFAAAMIGGQFVTMVGVNLMPLLSAGSWDFLQQV